MATFPKLERPVVASETFVVPAVLDLVQGRAAVRHVVTEGLLKPSDIEGADVEHASLLYLPFWRVDVSVDGFHIGIGSMTGSNGRAIPIPTGGAHHREAAVMVCARTIVPFELRLPSFFRISGPPALEVGVVDIVPESRAREALAVGEVVDADVSREQGERTASSLVLDAVRARNAIYQKYEPQIRSTTFVRYPVYYARYRYEGEARRHAGEQFFVMISGKTGMVVNAKHPSTMRAMATRLRKLLSFDRR
ncbi:MAG TPA: hypothetical protein VIF62_39360 [Labilithrix sp.]